MSKGSKHCPGCQTQNEGASAYCYRCGADLKVVPCNPIAAEGGLQWGWIGLAVLVSVGIFHLIGDTTMFFLRKLQYRADPGTLSLILTSVAAFFGGLIVGRASPSVTMKEPSIAIVAATIYFTLLRPDFNASSARHINGLLLVCLVWFVLGYVGAWLGEKLQGRASRGPEAARMPAHQVPEASVSLRAVN